MTGDRTPEAPRWLWNAVVGGLAVVILGASVLIIALALGWNSPRPPGSPDWQAPGLPRQLQASPGTTAIELLDYAAASSVPGPRGFALEGILAPVSGPEFNGYGFAYHAQDSGHYTVFALGSDGYYGVLRIGGDVEMPLVTWQQFPHIRRGWQANRLRIECSGTTCEFYINDEYATTVEDDSGTQGAFGLWVRSFEDESVAVEFTSLAVWNRD